MANAARRYEELTGRPASFIPSIPISESLLVGEYERALELIKQEGKVCGDFELCHHVACQSSCTSWFIADAALKGELDEYERAAHEAEEVRPAEGGSRLEPSREQVPEAGSQQSDAPARSGPVGGAVEQVIICCDRCGLLVEGVLSDCYTGGFYRRGACDVEPWSWVSLFNRGETDVCDPCMHADARYQRLYPSLAPAGPVLETVVEAGDYEKAPESDGRVKVTGSDWWYSLPTRAAHCDPLVLHQPGDCVHCDKYTDLQRHRLAAGIKFTGKDDRLVLGSPHYVREDLMPCPAEVKRGADCQVWPGNAPKKEGDRGYLG